ncbi:MAG: glycerol-3-phosphate 1-O-acyltransferase PlsY [Planctomycetota bacterium]
MASGGLIAAYLLGSVPFGVIVARARGVDLRAVGSGNIGATNVGRACGKPLGILVFVLDAAKGYAAAGPLSQLLLGLGAVPQDSLLRSSLGPLCAIAAFAGHVWPVYIGFRGGKGVATGAGAMLALEPVALAAGLGLWGLSLLLTRYMSVASMFGAVGAAGITLARLLRAGRASAEWPLLALVSLLALLVILRHRSNIGRLLKGQELKLGAKRNEGQPGTEGAP